MPYVAWIKKLHSLVDLSPEGERAIRALNSQVWSVDRSRDILRRLRVPDFLYVIVSGWAARYGLRSDGSRRITGFMLPGDFCGIHAVADGAMDHAIVALSDCEVLAIPIAEVKALSSNIPEFATALWRAKLVDEAMLRQWLLSSGDALQSVARMLCELNARARAAQLDFDGICSLPITQDQLGDAIGITGVHTNRTLKILRTEGLVDYKNGRLRVLRSDKLSEIGQWNDRYLTPWLAKKTIS